MIFKNINISFEDVFKMEIDSLDISASTTHIIGQNGVGKSTLFNYILSSLDKYKVSYINQDYRKSWIWWLPIMDNFKLATKNKGVKVFKDSKVWQDNAKWLESIIKKERSSYIPIDNGIETLGLSGGQIQRLVFIREMISVPDFVFLDEAFSAIDKENKLNLINQLRDLQAKYKFQIINITHHREDLDLLKGDIYHLQKINGRVDGEMIGLDKFKMTKYYEQMA